MGLIMFPKSPQISKIFTRISTFNLDNSHNKHKVYLCTLLILLNKFHKSYEMYLANHRIRLNVRCLIINYRPIQEFKESLKTILLRIGEALKQCFVYTFYCSCRPTYLVLLL